MTVSKSTLVGILLFGALLGAGTTALLVGDRSGAGDRGTAAPATAERKGAGRSGGSGGGVPESLSGREAADELRHRINQVGTDEDFRHFLSLVSRSAEWSAESTMEEVMQIEDPYKRHDALERLFRYWIGSDQEKALQAIAGLGNVALQRDLYRDAMRWLAQDDPVAAVRLLQESNNMHDHELWSRSFANWARTDREGAVQEVLAIENAGLRRQVLQSVAQRLAETDLRKAIEWVDTLDGEHGSVALAGVLRHAAEANPQTVADHLEKIPPGRLRDEIIGRAADEWAERDPEAALAWAEELEERERDRAIGEIAETVLEIDPDRAEEIIDLLPHSEQRTEVLQRIARLRAAVDLDAAIEWIATLPESDRAGAWGGAAREWSRIDPEGAAEFALTVDDPVARQQLVAAASSSWSLHDPAGAAAWARSLEGREQDQAMYRILDTWSRQDPAAAGDFIASSLEGDLQTATTRQVVNRWMKHDLTEASAWIDTLPDGQARDGAVFTLINSIEREFPETALQWAQTISNSQKREYAERRLQKFLGQ